MNALMQASVTFTSANFGARAKERLNRVLFTCLGVVTAVGLLLGRKIVVCVELLLARHPVLLEPVHPGLVGEVREHSFFLVHRRLLVLLG